MYAAPLLTTPAGMRDWLPYEAKTRREMLDTALANMAAWGYREVATPVLEYYEVLKKGEGGFGPDHLYKLIDRDGRILALRPEMTTPIARIASGKLPGTAPWRLMYGAQVFRYEEIQTGKQREFNQVGVELIGQAGPEADSEVLALAIDTLKRMGLNSFTVSLGHTGILRGLLENLAAEEAQLNEAKNLILEKDFVGLHQFLNKAGLNGREQQSLAELLTRHLKPPEIKENMNRLPAAIREALNELLDIYGFLEKYGYADYLTLDLSTLRSQAYYTGMVFEIYTSGIGYPIGGGGRYDRLLQLFGRDYPATGFALGLERVMLSLTRGNGGSENVMVAGANPADILKRCDELRKSGTPAIAELRKLSQAEAGNLAKDKNARLEWI